MMKAIDENPKFFDARLKKLIDNVYSNVHTILPINESLLEGKIIISTPMFNILDRLEQKIQRLVKYDDDW